MLENDQVEAIPALPTDEFHNTGISTYGWIPSTYTVDDRQGLVQFFDASGFWRKMRKSLGFKLKELSAAAHIHEITRLFGEFMAAHLVTVFHADGREVGRSVVLDGHRQAAS